MEDTKFTFFWKDKSVFSQWHPSVFVAEGITFTHAEQYMMYKKSMLFGDEETAKEVLKAKHPRDQKVLGRKVKNFVKEIWEDDCKKFVYEASFYKFTQNEEMKKALFDTVGTTLIEASPYDKIWGIGLDEEQAKKMDPSKWPGKNWLGEILTKLRDDLLKE